MGGRSSCCSDISCHTLVSWETLDSLLFGFRNGHIFGFQKSKKNDNFRYPEMGTHSVPISGPFLLKIVRRFPFLGTKYVPISGYPKSCFLVSGTRNMPIPGTTNDPNFEALMACASNWGLVVACPRPSFKPHPEPDSKPRFYHIYRDAHSSRAMS